MKRHYLLIGGCLLGAASVGVNIYLYRQRHSPPPNETPKEMVITLPEDGSSDKQGESERRTFPAMPEVKFDFSDTAFADDSWKLTDPPSTIKLDQPFSWDDANPAKPKVNPDNLVGAAGSSKKPPVMKESYPGAPDGGIVEPAPPK